MAEAATQLARQIFQSKEVRIYGTSTAPLFVAADIGVVLGLTNVHVSIAKFEGYKKQVISGAYTPSGKQDMVALTESGLYSLVLKSKKPVAREFEKWLLTEVLPSLRKEGKYEMPTAPISKSAEDIDLPAPPITPTVIHTPEKSTMVASPPPIPTLSTGSLPFQTLDSNELTPYVNQWHTADDESNSQIAHLKQENERLAAAYKPMVTYHQCDINDYIDDPCIYLFHLKDNDYKYGRSGEIDVRSGVHMHSFKKHGCTIRLIKVWRCASMKIMTRVEKMIKTYARQNEIATEKYDQTEIITTDNVDHVVAAIDKYVTTQNATSENVIKMQMMQLELQRLQLENEGRRLDLERARLNYHARVIEKNNLSIPLIEEAPQAIRDDDSGWEALDNYPSGDYSNDNTPLVDDSITCDTTPTITNVTAAPANTTIIPTSVSVDDSAKIQCACGKKMNAASYSTHLRSKVHTKRMHERASQSSC
jgi:prophage antirepressor-like protein